MKTLGVGLIGANPDRGWAISSHLPALLAADGRDGYRLAAVGTSRRETAERASDKFGVPGFFDYRDLILSPDVDIVTVSVKLPLHREIVSAALTAGKHVYCEWPLGRDAHEADALARTAREMGVHTMIGLQARGSATIAKLCSLIADGYVGRILGVSVVASGMGWGSAIDAGNAYLFDRSNGATLLTITGGHLLDTIARACGKVDIKSAYLPTLRSQVAILSADDLARYRSFAATLRFECEENGPGPDPDVIDVTNSFTPTSMDQVALLGELEGGAPLTMHLRGGLLRGTGLLVEIIGTHGELRLTGPAGVIQMVPLALSGARGAKSQLDPIAVETGSAVLGPIAGNLACLYAVFANDIASGTRSVADFEHAARHQRFLATIEMGTGGSPV